MVFCHGNKTVTKNLGFENIWYHDIGLNKASKTDYMKARKKEVRGEKVLDVWEEGRWLVWLLAAVWIPQLWQVILVLLGRLMTNLWLKEGQSRNLRKELLQGSNTFLDFSRHRLENLRSQREPVFLLPAEILYHGWARVEDSGREELHQDKHSLSFEVIDKQELRRSPAHNPVIAPGSPNAYWNNAFMAWIGKAFLLKHLYAQNVRSELVQQEIIYIKHMME